MKKMLIFVAIVSLVTGSLFADEAVLIDFTLLATGGEGEHEATMMDFSNVRFGGSFTQDQKDAMKTSLAIENWEVVLAPSARTVDNMVRSRTRESESKEFGTVMGVRVRFPVEPYNSWAIVKPPFEIPAYEPAEEGDDERGSRFEGGYGVIKNVGTIKSVAVNVYGLNFPHGLSTLILDQTGNQRSMFMGYLNFDGWAELVWVNPAYIQEVRNRDLRLFPLYPDSTPFIKFAGFELKRDAMHRGGDFITYFRDVKVIYDRAVLDPDRDIDDEEIWNIIGERETARRVWEMERFGHNQVLRYLDAQKQATEPPFGSPERDQ
ncbi:MAG: flagellar filament outer layer protein FlaA [Treponema sp.]|nr:flagellar filament outer layer protein FlaA [Treponema sp.]